MKLPDDDGRTEVRGVIATNGRGELCFFPTSRADGFPIHSSAASMVWSASHAEDRLTHLIEAIDAAPARRVTHAQIAALDPDTNRPKAPEPVQNIERLDRLACFIVALLRSGVRIGKIENALDRSATMDRVARFRSLERFAYDAAERLVPDRTDRQDAPR